jgi:16S rRNA (adenine1518-N6/adenine1519-N6)-dimethyltransferase
VFEKVTQAMFTRRRKTLANALRAYATPGRRPSEMLARAGLDGGRRPETLTIAEIASLADAYAAAVL